MKKILIKSTYILLSALIITGCKAVQNSSHKQRGATVGATSGAVIGGVLGNNVGKSDNTVLGAIIGAAIGGVAGGYIGDRMDRQAERIEEEIPGAEVTCVGEGINVTFTQGQGVFFDTNKSNIAGNSVETLNSLAGIFEEYPDSYILVEGHTDSAGSDDYNMTLSRQRAESVTDYLIEKGIDAGRFTTKWYGENQPKADNTTAEGKSKNRRVELAIVASQELKDEAKKRAGKEV